MFMSRRLSHSNRRISSHRHGPTDPSCHFGRIAPKPLIWPFAGWRALVIRNIVRSADRTSREMLEGVKEACGIFRPPLSQSEPTENLDGFRICARQAAPPGLTVSSWKPPTVTGPLKGVLALLLLPNLRRT